MFFIGIMLGLISSIVGGYLLYGNNGTGFIFLVLGLLILIVTLFFNTKTRKWFENFSVADCVDCD